MAGSPSDIPYSFIVWRRGGMSEKHIFKEKLNAEVKAEGQRHLW
jgi:hypothetical protein